MEPGEAECGIPKDLANNPLLEHAKRLREAGLSSVSPTPELVEKTTAICMESVLARVFDWLRVGDLVLVDLPEQRRVRCRVIGFEIRARAHSVRLLQEWRTPIVSTAHRHKSVENYVFGQYKFIKRIPNLSLWKRWRIFWAIRHLVGNLQKYEVYVSPLKSLQKYTLEHRMGARILVILPDSLPTRDSIKMTEKVEKIGKEIAKNSNLEFIMFEQRDLIEGYGLLPCGFRT